MLESRTIGSKISILVFAISIFLASALACGSDVTSNTLPTSKSTEAPQAQKNTVKTTTATHTSITPDRVRQATATTTQSHAISPAPTNALPEVSAVNSNINLRKGPGTSYDIVGTLHKGESLPIIGRNNDASWWQVSTPNGTAWIAAFVSQASNVDTDNIPIIEVLSSETPTRSGGDLIEVVSATPPLNTLCPNPAARITSPENGSQLSSSVVSIKGSANISNFERYKMEYSLNPDADAWMYLFEKNTPVNNGVLMELNTSTVPKGPYGIRLTVIDHTGNYPEPCVFWYNNSSGSVSSNLPSVPPAGWGCSCQGDIYDCGNFGSHDQAQACFNYCLQKEGWDVHKLDRDNDGIACESLP